VGGSCQVDFYLLSRQAMGRHKLACRLALMALEHGHRIAIAVPDQEQAKALDDLLWSFPAGRFVPHGVEGKPEAAMAPVRIGLADQLGEADCLINLCQQAVADPHPEPDRIAARQKFRFYRDQGLDPQHHPIDT
jgi:DNA polymerase-3 subunit chi